MIFSRRTFLCTAAAGLVAPSYSGQRTASDSITCDVLVAGSGMAGLCAAIAAREAGAQHVILLEKGGLLGGHTLYSSGSIAVVSPKRQNPIGITDSVEHFVQDAMLAGNGKGDPELLAKIARESEEGVDWLESLGISFGPIFLAMSGISPRCVAMPGNSAGRSYVIALTQTAQAAGVRILFRSPLTQLQQQNEGWYAYSGSQLRITARAVILATGGFTANIDWRRRIRPELTSDIRTSANPDGTAWDGAMGDGIRIARLVGADIRSGYGLQLLPFWGGRLLDYVGGDIYLDNQGLRFIDESRPWNQIASAVLRLPEKRFWVITDCQSHKGATLGLKLINGIVKKSYSIEEVARGMGVSPSMLEETMNRYNRYAAQHEDPDFGKKTFTQQINKPPYYWGEEHIFVHTSLDGIRTNTVAQVIDRQGSVIPGLFAAGETVGGIFGTDRLGGASLSNCLVMGREAGRQAALWSQKNATTKIVGG